MSTDYPRTGQFTDAGAAARAEEANCTVEIPGSQEIQLDIDTTAALNTFNSQLGLLVDLNLVTVVRLSVRASRNGNTHIVLNVGYDLDDTERLLLQALLGSDLKREALSLKGLRSGMQHPTLLFRPKPKQ